MRSFAFVVCAEVVEVVPTPLGQDAQEAWFAGEDAAYVGW